MWQREGKLKQVSFIKLTKGFVAFGERKDAITNNHLQLHQGKGVL